MADVNSVINTTELTQQLSGYILDKMSPLISIFKVVGIVILVYIIFLIVRALFRWKTAFDIAKIAKNVEEINEKLDVLISKTEYKEIKQRAEEGKETKQKFEEAKKKKGIFKRLFGKSEKEETKKIEKDKSIKRK